MAIERIAHGPVAICDGCTEDFAERDDMGGAAIYDRVYCAACATTELVKVTTTHPAVTRLAYPWERFKDFVYRLRGQPDAETVIYTGEDAVAYLAGKGAEAKK